MGRGDVRVSGAAGRHAGQRGSKRRKQSMNKYQLRRIGVASNAAAPRPSLSACIELVLDQSDALVGDILDALKAPVLKTPKEGERDDVDPAIRFAVHELLDEIVLVRSSFGDALRRLVYHSGLQDFGEAPMSCIAI